MIITIHGEDSFRSRESLEEIVERYKKKYSETTNFKFFDENSSGKDLENIKNFFSQNLIFKEPKFAVAQNCLSFFSESSSWERIKNNKDDLLVFFESQEIEKDKIDLIEKYGKVYHFKLLNEKELESWAKNEFNKRGGKIEQSALSKLLKLTENNTWLLSEEINKLVCFHPEKEITLPDVNLLVNSVNSQSIDQFKIFKAIDHAFSDEKDRALLLIRELINEGKSISYIFSIFSYQLRNMIIVKTSPSSEVTKKLKMSPFVLRKSLYQSARFSLEELKEIYNNLLKSEFGIKIGKIDSETALELFLTGIK